MTDLIERVACSRARAWARSPIREYWLDIGQIADYERALDEHATYFSST